MPYQFSYTVASPEHGTYLGHQESKNSRGVTQGSYYLFGADGQWHQTIYDERGSGYHVITQNSPANKPPPQASSMSHSTIKFGEPTNTGYNYDIPKHSFSAKTITGFSGGRGPGKSTFNRVSITRTSNRGTGKTSGNRKQGNAGKKSNNKVEQTIAGLGSTGKLGSIGGLGGSAGLSGAAGLGSS